MRLARTIATAAAITVGTLGLAAPAHAAEWSHATDWTVTTDMNGWASVKVKYSDRGVLGNHAQRVCVKAEKHLTRSAKVELFMGDRWSTDTYRWTFGRFKGLADGSWTCKRVSDHRRSLALDDSWRWKGTFSGPFCIGSFCPFEGYGAARGRMS